MLKQLGKDEWELRGKIVCAAHGHPLGEPVRELDIDTGSSSLAKLVEQQKLVGCVVRLTLKVEKRVEN